MWWSTILDLQIAWGPPTTYLTAFNSLVDHLNLESDNIDKLVPWHKHINLDGSLFGPNKCQGTNTVNRKQRWHIQLSASVIIFCKRCAVWISRRTSFSSMFCWNGRQRQCSCMSDISIHGRTRVLRYLADTQRDFELKCPKITSRLIATNNSTYCPVRTFEVNLLFLTLMLLVANFSNTQWCKKPEKWLKPWHMGTHLRVLSESSLMGTNMTGFRRFSELFAFFSHGGN